MQNSQKTPVPESPPPSKAAGPRPATPPKKRPWHRRLSMNSAKFPLLQNTLGRPPLPSAIQSCSIPLLPPPYHQSPPSLYIHPHQSLPLLYTYPHPASPPCNGMDTYICIMQAFGTAGSPGIYGISSRDQQDL